VTLIDRINAYLQGGGLFNPEMADHDAVRDLLMDCRDALAPDAQPRGEPAEPPRERECPVCMGRGYHECGDNTCGAEGGPCPSCHGTGAARGEP
jgi:hypothetical protein